MHVSHVNFPYPVAVNSAKRGSSSKRDDWELKENRLVITF